MTDSTITTHHDDRLSACQTCGAATLDSDKFCGSCGTRFQDDTGSQAVTTQHPTMALASAAPPYVFQNPGVAGGPVLLSGAVAGPRGLARTATLSDVLAALLIAAVLFASIATVAILMIDDPGRTGAQGAQGAQGVQGVQGERGPRGSRGSEGRSGANGVNGANGSDGRNGRACSNDPDVPLPFC